MANFDVFLEKLQQRYGFEYFGVFLGLYRARVTRNDDPEGRGRIQIECPRAGHRGGLGVWVDPSFPNGMFFPPEVGDTVKVQFDRGDPGKPSTYIGGWWTEDGMPNEFRYSADKRPERRGIVTRAGHRFLFTDEPDSESIRLVWHKPDPNDPALSDVTLKADRTQGEFSVLSFEPDGSVQLANNTGSRLDINTTNKQVMVTHEDGHSITMDEEGIKAIDKEGNYFAIIQGQTTVLAKDTIHMIAPKVNLKSGAVFLGDGAAERLVLGDSFVPFFNGHFHPTGAGPSGVPTVPMTPALLSQTVKSRK